MEDQLLKQQETMLEVGMLLAVAGIALAALLMIFSRTLEAGSRLRKAKELPPEAGEIPAGRHQHIGVVAAR